MSDALQIQCPHCGQQYNMTPEQRQQYTGQQITCTKCQQPFVVGAAGAMNAPAAAPGTFAPPVIPPAAGSGAAPFGQSDAAFAPQVQEGNGIAVASLVMGLLMCIPVVTNILAIIFGIMGINRANKPTVQGRGKGLAIAGLVLGCVGLTLGSLWWAIMLPALSAGRQAANQVRSQTNLRQIGTACMLYSNDNGGRFPPDLGTLVTDSTLTMQVCFHPTTGVPANVPSPAAYVNANSDYVYLGAGKSNTAFPTTVLAYEKLHLARNSRINVLYVDGRVQPLFVYEIEQVLGMESITPQQ